MREKVKNGDREEKKGEGNRLYLLWLQTKPLRKAKLLWLERKREQSCWHYQGEFMALVSLPLFLYKENEIINYFYEISWTSCKAFFQKKKKKVAKLNN